MQIAASAVDELTVSSLSRTSGAGPVDELEAVTVDPSRGRVDLVRSAESITLRLSGIFDLHAVRVLKLRADDALDSGCHIVIDGAAVERLDCCALQVLVALRREADRTGGSLTVAGGAAVSDCLGWAGCQHLSQGPNAS